MSVIDLARRRLAGDYEIDEWGFDADLVEVLSAFGSLRWSLDVSGTGHLPTDGAALLVHNRGFGVSGPFVLARGVREETGRYVRTSGVPDMAMVGPFLRRLGGVLANPAETASLLHAGHLVSVGLERTLTRRLGPGSAPIGHVLEARRLGVPVLPVALVGSEFRRSWRVEIGAAMDDEHALGPLGDAEIAEHAAQAVAELLDSRARN